MQMVHVEGKVGSRGHVAYLGCSCRFASTRAGNGDRDWFQAFCSSRQERLVLNTCRFRCRKEGWFNLDKEVIYRLHLHMRSCKIRKIICY